jgi:uncharacterized MAPEG superfamily protein
MTTPLWCLVIVAFLPYVWAPFAAAARKQQLGSIDNKLPRLQYAQLTGRGARALGAHQNAFEAIAVFTPAVLIAHLAGADPVWSARLALTFVAARVAHGVTYLADIDIARSASFLVAQVCAIGLIVLAARAA